MADHVATHALPGLGAALASARMLQPIDEHSNRMVAPLTHADESDSGSRITVEFARGRGGLEAIANEWLNLEAAGPNPAFCNRVAWFRAYLHRLADRPEEIVFVLGRSGDRLVLVLPMRMNVRRIAGLRVRILQSVIDKHLNLADGLMDPSVDPAHTMRNLVRAMRKQQSFDWDAMRLAHVPVGSRVAVGLTQTNVGLSLKYEDRATTLIDCNRTFEDAASAIPGAFRRNLRRLARRASSTGGLSYESYARTEVLHDALSRFLQVEAHSWKGRHGTGSAIALRAEVEDFYRQLVDQFGPRGQCVINLLRHGSQDAAAQFCLQTDGVLHILKIGFDEAHAEVAPGHLLMEHTLRTACEDETIRALSFVTHPTWSHLWRPKIIPLQAIHVFNTTPTGALMYQGNRIHRNLTEGRESA